MASPEAFFLIGAIIIAGYLSKLFFEKTKIPDVLLLMLLGVLVGPVLRVVDVTVLSQAAPFVGVIALIVILFEGGLNLNAFKVLTELGGSTAFTVLTFVFSSALTAGALSFFFGWQPLHALLLGIVVGGTSSEIVLAIVSGVRIPESLKVMLTLESVLTDALVVILSVVLLQVIGSSGAVAFDSVANQLLGAFSIAAFIALIAGAAWVRVLMLMQEKGMPFSYMLSLASVFVVYAAVEGIRANGAFAVLVFGLVLGNAGEVAKKLQLEREYAVGSSFRSFQTEFTFFIRTFFFVFLGMLFDFGVLNFSLILVAGAVLASILVARYFSATIFSRFDRAVAENKQFIVTLVPRGLAPAVLAYLPLKEGVAISGFSEIVLLIIFATGAITAFGTYFSQRRLPPTDKTDAGSRPAAPGRPQQAGQRPLPGRQGPKIVKQF